MITLPEDCYLDYVLPKEAWYREVVREEPEIQIRASSRGGGCLWEFAAVEVENIGVQLRIFDDAWRALNDIPEFFQIIAASGQGTTLDDVRKILDGMGAVDSTERTRPTPDPERRVESATVTVRFTDGTDRVINFLSTPAEPLVADLTITRGRANERAPQRNEARVYLSGLTS